MVRYKINWFVNPSQVRNIVWKDLPFACEETVSFEPNGSLESRYIWATRKKDNKFMRVGIIKNLFVMPFLFGVAELIAIYDLLNNNSVMVELFCVYVSLLLVFLHYFLRFSDGKKVLSNEKGCFS